MSAPPLQGERLAAWFARHHHLPFSPQALRSQIPHGLDANAPEALARILAAAGLRVRSARRKPAQIDGATLPCIVFTREGQARILTALDARRKRLTLLDPSQPELEQEITFRSFSKGFSSHALLVSPQAPATLAHTEPRGWFWQPVVENWPSWCQVMLASLLIQCFALALPLFVMNVYDRVIPNLAFTTLTTLAIGVAMALICDVLLRVLRTSVLEGIGQSVDLRVASALFSRALRVRLLELPGGASGTAGRIRDFETVREFFASASLVALIDLAFIGVFIAVLAWIAGPLAYVPLLALPLSLGLALLAQWPLRRVASQALEGAARRNAVLHESFAGLESVRSLSAEPVMLREWEAAVAQASRINARTRIWGSLATHGTLLIQQSVSVLIIVWGVLLVADGTLTVGALIAANILSGRALAPLAAISQTLFRAHYARHALGALNALMAQPIESIGVCLSPSGPGAIEVRELTYTYPESTTPALNNISFRIAPGESVALLGQVGSGKSTLCRLLSGLLPPSEGSVLLDNTALTQYHPASLRASVGYLPQHPDLFRGTLRENLLLGHPEASDHELERALYFAGVDHFVATLPNGLDLDLSERGNRLSGGQRQGIALARLLLRKPRWLVLDEPTNAMDQAMEARISARLNELARSEPGTGMVLCTHRHSLATIAARFIVLQNGRIARDGPRESVMQSLGVPQEKGG